MEKHLASTKVIVNHPPALTNRSGIKDTITDENGKYIGCTENVRLDSDGYGVVRGWFGSDAVYVTGSPIDSPTLLVHVTENVLEQDRYQQTND